MNFYNPGYIIDTYGTKFDKTIVYGGFISHWLTLRFFDSQTFTIRGRTRYNDPNIARIFVNGDWVFIPKKHGDFFEFQFACRFVYKKTTHQYKIALLEEVGYIEEEPLDNTKDLFSHNAVIQEFLQKIGYSPTKSTNNNISDLSLKFTFAIGKGKEDFNYRTGDDSYCSLVYNQGKFTTARPNNVKNLSKKFANTYDEINNIYKPWLNSII
ncbi:MAG: hypothetical protein ACOC56_03525 [Atribacterota bacterium]